MADKTDEMAVERDGSTELQILYTEPNHEKKDDCGYTGLTKEELMLVANDPFWKRVRLVMFILFWVAWISMLIAAIIIIVLSPKCPKPVEDPRDSLEKFNFFWEKDSMYIYNTLSKSLSQKLGLVLDYIKLFGFKIMVVPDFYGMQIKDNKWYGFLTGDWEPTEFDNASNIKAFFDAVKDVKIVVPISLSLGLSTATSTGPKSTFSYVDMSGTSRAANSEYCRLEKQCYPKLDDEFMKIFQRKIKYYLDLKVAAFILMDISVAAPPTKACGDEVKTPYGAYLTKCELDSYFAKSTSKFVKDVRKLLEDEGKTRGWTAQLLVGTTYGSSLSAAVMKRMRSTYVNATSGAADVAVVGFGRLLDQTRPQRVLAPGNSTADWRRPLRLPTLHQRKPLGSMLAMKPQQLADLSLVSLLLPGNAAIYDGIDPVRLSLMTGATDKGDDAAYQPSFKPSLSNSVPMSQTAGAIAKTALSSESGTPPFRNMALLLRSLVALRGEPAFTHGAYKCLRGCPLDPEEPGAVIVFTRCHASFPCYLVAVKSPASGAVPSLVTFTAATDPLVYGKAVRANVTYYPDDTYPPLKTNVTFKLETIMMGKGGMVVLEYNKK